jgi:hypothetical protein
METTKYIYNIKSQMLLKQLTIKELSRSFAGVCGYQRVARILRGDAIPTKKECALFARALRCSQKELFGGNEHE